MPLHPGKGLLIELAWEGSVTEGNCVRWGCCMSERFLRYLHAVYTYPYDGISYTEVPSWNDIPDTNS